MDYFVSYPTSFRNVNYRSRLEAKWASFFTDLGWHFQYEPFDLKGWVPDFEIKTNNSKRILVEVKPASFHGDSMDNCLFNMQETFAKAIVYSDEYSILLLGTGPFIIDGFWCIGVMVENYEFDWMFLKPSSVGYDISSYLMDWTGRINRNTNYRKEFIEHKYHPEIEGFWADAHNNTKFEAFRYYNGFNSPQL